MILDNLLLETKPLYLDSVIDNFGQLKNVPASLKHANGKFIICNSASAKRDGIAIEDYIGLTAHDLGKLTNRKSSVTQNAVEADKRLFNKEVSFVNYKYALLAHDQSIVIEDVFKRPVLASKHQVAATLGCARDITHHAHPMFLFTLYESYLPTQTAIQHFLRYKKLDNHFETTLSREELLTLLAMRDNKEISAIANQLQYNTSDVKRYQVQLQEKLRILSLKEVVNCLAWHDPEAAKDAIGGINK